MTMSELVHLRKPLVNVYTEPWIESIASKTSHLLKNSSHFHLETTVCTATKESIVARVVARGAFAVWLLLELTVVQYQISSACHALRHFYILFLTTIYSKCIQVSSIRWVSVFKGGRVGSSTYVGSAPTPIFFFFIFFPLPRVHYFFFFPPRCL